MLLTLSLVSLLLGPVLYAAASTSHSSAAPLPSLTGTITKVDLAHHVVVVKVTKGAAKYKGKAVTLNLKSSPPGATAVTRLGHAGKLIGLKKNDRVVVTYKLNAAGKPVAAHVTDSGPAPVLKPKPTPTPTVTQPTSTVPPTTGPTDTTAPPVSTSPPATTEPANVVEIDATPYQYSPQPLSVPVGTTVKFVINGGLPHTFTSGSGGVSDGKFDGSSTGYEFTFNTPGTYPFFCQYHYATHNMQGTITVTP